MILTTADWVTSDVQDYCQFFLRLVAHLRNVYMRYGNQSVLSLVVRLKDGEL